MTLMADVVIVNGNSIIYRGCIGKSWVNGADNFVVWNLIM